MRRRRREALCDTATALATVNGNEIRNHSHCLSDGKARRVGQHFGRESGDRPLNASLPTLPKGRRKETF
jgi:hypothetical protein